MAELMRRRPEAVRELELLQQEERANAGEPELAPEQFREILRQDVLQRFVRDQFNDGGIEAAVRGAGNLEARADAELARLLRVWHVEEPDQWSRFETYATRWEIAHACARVEEVFARQGWQLPQVPVIGTLTTGQVTAVTQRTASGATLVLIDNGFFRFSGTIAQLAVLAHDRSTHSADVTLQLVSDFVATLTVLQTCLYLYPRPTPAPARAEVDSFKDAITLFVLGHEYAHIAYGDLDAQPRSGPSANATLRAREFAADRAGFTVALHATAGPASGAAGPFLFFCGLDLMARGEAAYRGTPSVVGTNSPDQYPTPFERTVQLLEWVESSPELAFTRATARDAAARYNEILFVWDRIQPVFAAARHEMAQFDPSQIGNKPVSSGAATFGLVTQLWQAVRAATR